MTPPPTPYRDHGGDMDRARALYGEGDWIDLSTGINPVPYPVPAMPPSAWTALPTRAEVAVLEAVARERYDTRAEVVALAGAQAAIQLVPRLSTAGEARVVAPTYNEHAGALRAQGWCVAEVPDLAGLAGADLGVVVTPNNPDGRRVPPEALLVLREKVGLLVVDESFADPTPECSLAPHLDPTDGNVLVLRSLGKFYGLAGLRLGFALTGAHLAGRLRALAGPWSVSGPAIVAGRVALADNEWRNQTMLRLQEDARRLDAMAGRAGWSLVGGTTLFRTFDVADAAAVQRGLAEAHIWTRIFPYSECWIRLGLPAGETAWRRLAEAMEGLRTPPLSAP